MSILSDIGTAIKNKLGGTSVDNTVPRYDGTTCKLQGSGVTISDTNVVTASGGFVGNLTGNAATSTKLTTSSGDWSASGVIGNVVGMLSWKNYGNGHVIFDASNGTAPNGVAVNNTNAQTAWSPTYPTLMGWNGYTTHGVRVDSARVADSTTYATAFTTAVGSAPSYACRAWVNFNGTGTVAIRASGNVSSITDNGTGYYTVNFTTAMSDVNYCSNGSSIGTTNSGAVFVSNDKNRPSTTSSFSVMICDANGNAADITHINLAIFR